MLSHDIEIVYGALSVQQKQIKAFFQKDTLKNFSYNALET
jgi:hypothetical protein